MEVSFEFPLNSIWPILLCMLSLGSGNLNSWGQSVGINQAEGSVLCVSVPAHAYYQCYSHVKALNLHRERFLVEA